MNFGIGMKKHNRRKDVRQLQDVKKGGIKISLNLAVVSGFE